MYAPRPEDGTQTAAGKIHPLVVLVALGPGLAVGVMLSGGNSARGMSINRLNAEHSDTGLNPARSTHVIPNVDDAMAIVGKAVVVSWALLARL